MSVCARTCFLLGCTYCGCIHLGGTQQRMWECVLHFLPRLSGGCLMTRCMVWIAVRRVSLSGDAGNICSEHFSWAGVSVLKRIYFWSHVHHLDFFFLWYSHRKKQKTGFLHVFLYLVLWPVLGGGANSLTCLYQNQTPEACVPDPYWTNLRQWSQQLRTLMIWTHWGLVLSAHRLPARSPINSFLLKLFARQHKSILFCLGQGWPVWNMSDIFIYFFPHECVKWLADMHGEEKKNTQGQWFGFIGISISALIFIRDAFVIILFSPSSTGLNYISYHPWY